MTSTARTARDKRFPLLPADQLPLTSCRTIDVGTGLDRATDPSLSAETLRGTRDAVTKGPDNIQAKILAAFLEQFEQHNGYLIGDIGHYGTDYELRAMTDKIGVGALKPKIAIYPFAHTAATAPRYRARRYVLHIPSSRCRSRRAVSGR